MCRAAALPTRARGSVTVGRDMDDHSGTNPEVRAKEDPEVAPAGPRPPIVEPPDAAPARRSHLRPFLWLLLIAAIVGAVVWYFPRSARHPQFGRFGPAGMPVPVGVATARTGDMPVILSGLGTVTPLATVTVEPQISGYLMSVGFNEGQHVTRGDFLAQIDPRPYQVALEQAQAQLAKDQAALKNAEVDLKRYNTLVAQNSIATQTRDTQIALVAQNRAQVLLDQAQIDQQKLNLYYCHITSPVTGRVGLRQVDPGNYVTPTSSPSGLVVVTQTQPISVIFTLPEDSLPEVLKEWHAGATLEATAYDRTGTVKIASGKLETIDNQIDPTTGMVKLRAIFPNTDESLFPNQFVNIRLLVRTLPNAVLVSTAAIQRGAPGTFVYKVEPNHTVAVQKVALGPVDGQKVAILSGLKPGDQVVDDGTDRLKAGAKVTIAKSEGAKTAAMRPGAVDTGHAGQHGRRRAPASR
jgi:membrane fusion protein, multidrug efflux system